MFNIPVVLGAALIPTIVGFIWYNPKVMGEAWMKAAEMTEEKMKGANMAMIFGVSLLLSVLLSVQVHRIAIHQGHLDSIFFELINPENAESAIHIAYLENFMATYGDLYRSFGHGVLHGTFAGIFFVLPVLGTNSLFERKGWKYIWINTGYWTITLALMGGVICQFD